MNQTPFQFASFGGRVGFPNYSVTLLVKGTFKLAAGGLAVPEEEQIFPTGDEYTVDGDGEQRSCRYESDFGYFKPRADLLLVGKCHAPRSKPIEKCQVLFQVGMTAKSLDVFGNRYWKAGPAGINATSPEPFTELDLCYDNSFGGIEYKRNPVGKGYAKNARREHERQPLPNVEDPNHRIDSPLGETGAAGFGPVGRMWEQRVTKLGTYDDKWLKERWPWFPEDLEWRHFNAAPEDMQVEGYLRGDEELFFENLHRDYSLYRSRLPGLRVRCFLNELAEPGMRRADFREVLMNLDTLWVDMEAERLVLTWRGVASVRSEDYDEILHVFIAAESLESGPESISYYQELFHRRLLESAEPENLSDEPLLEETDTPGEVDIEAEIAKAKAERRASLIAAGIDPDRKPPPPSQEARAAEARILKELGVRQATEEEAPLTRETVQRRISRGEMLSGEDLSGIDLSGLELKGIDLREAILAGASFENADLSGAALTRANLAGANLSGANVTKARLEEADLTGANLRTANLTAAILSGANFDKAEMESAVLDQAIGRDTVFSMANLSKASARDADLSGADFSKCRLIQANFRGCILREASVEGAAGVDMDLSDADLTDLRASDGADFSRASFRKVIGSGSTWEKANLHAADFSYAQLQDADFSSASLERVNCYAADLRFARFIHANLRRARLTMANFFQAVLEKADLTGADCRASNFYGAEFLGAVIEGARLDSANLRMTKLARS